MRQVSDLSRINRLAPVVAPHIARSNSTVSYACFNCNATFTLDLGDEAGPPLYFFCPRCTTGVMSECDSED